LAGAVLALAAVACHGRSGAPTEQRDGSKPTAAGLDRAGADDAWVSGCWKGGPVTCDPRTNGGCNTAAGQVCELGQNASKAYTLLCFPPPNPQRLGQTCNRKTGPYCAATLHCAPDGTCHHFCCSNVDCKEGDECIPLPGGNFGTIGVCAKGPFDAGPDGS
jgi:hypothetical protein